LVTVAAIESLLPAGTRQRSCCGSAVTSAHRTIPLLPEPYVVLSALQGAAALPVADTARATSTHSPPRKRPNRYIRQQSKYIRPYRAALAPDLGQKFPLGREHWYRVAAHPALTQARRASSVVTFPLPLTATGLGSPVRDTRFVRCGHGRQQKAQSLSGLPT